MKDWQKLVQLFAHNRLYPRTIHEERCTTVHISLFMQDLPTYQLTSWKSEYWQADVVEVRLQWLDIRMLWRFVPMH